MPKTARDVALDESNCNQPFAEAVESEVTSQYHLLALFAQMYMDQQREEQIRRKHVLLETLTADPDNAVARDELNELELELASPVYEPLKSFGKRAEAIERAKKRLSEFKVVGLQRPTEANDREMCE